jgi:hypothetical protein
MKKKRERTEEKEKTGKSFGGEVLCILSASFALLNCFVRMKLGVK